MSEKGCGDTIEAIWRENHEVSGEQKLLKKFDNCGKKLATWSKNSFGNVRRELEKKRKLLAKAKQLALSGGSVNRKRLLENEINKLMDHDATMWGQRSKVQWLKDGDRNMQFFHSKSLE